jgi:hypothetical protein
VRLTGGRRPADIGEVRGRSVLLVALVAVGLLGAAGPFSRTTPAPAPAAVPARPPAPDGGAGLRFAPDVHPLDRRAVLAAVASARPPARRLIGLVDGAVTVRIGPTGRAEAVGLTRADARGYVVTLDLAAVIRRSGDRGVRRLVLHELGHVVRFSLVSPSLLGRLDAEVPRGYPCPAGQPTSACAPAEERFAETFAKWGSGDLGAQLWLGYAVPPPASLDAWGGPLARLGN